MSIVTNRIIKLICLIIIGAIGIVSWFYANKGFKEGEILIKIPQKHATNTLITEYKNCSYTKEWEYNDQGVRQKLFTDRLKKCDVTFRSDLDPNEDSIIYINLFNEKKIVVNKEARRSLFGPNWRAKYKGKDVLLKIKDGRFGIRGFIGIGEQTKVGFIADVHFELKNNQIIERVITKKYIHSEAGIE